MTMPLLDLTTPRRAIREFSFPDGQPHLSLRAPGGPIRLAARITSSDDLMRLLMAQNILQAKKPRDVHLYLGYVMGGRMDRAMPPDDKQREQPFTLKVVADCLKTAGFASITVFDPHSDVTPALLNAKTVLPIEQVRQALQSLPKNTFLVAPDAGAAKRVDQIAQATNRNVVFCVKHRDSSTGALSGFGLSGSYDLRDRECLIVDDICDGGRTFTGVSKTLRDAGAEKVHLYVSHGIFSGDYGFAIPGLHRIFTTNAYQTCSPQEPEFTVLDWMP